jgi:hypothetical protein
MADTLTNVTRLHNPLRRDAALDKVALDEGLPAAGQNACGSNRSNLVERRVFAGLRVEQTADVMGISTARVLRESTRAWLSRGITGEEEA